VIPMSRKKLLVLGVVFSVFVISTLLFASEKKKETVWQDIPPVYQAEAASIQIEDADRTYYPLNPGSEHVVRLKGPALLRVSTRLDFSDPKHGGSDYEVFVISDRKEQKTYRVETAPSSISHYEEGAGHSPGLRRDFDLFVLDGEHEFRFLVSSKAPVYFRFRAKPLAANKLWDHFTANTEEKPEALSIGEASRKYHALNPDERFVFSVEGPTTLRLTFRGLQQQIFETGTYEIKVYEDNFLKTSQVFKSRIDSNAVFPEQAEGEGVGERQLLFLEIPEGGHVYEIMAQPKLGVEKVFMRSFEMSEPYREIYQEISAVEDLGPIQERRENIFSRVLSYKDIGGSGFSAGFFGSYFMMLDSNIFRFSRSEIDEFDDGLRRDTKYRGIRTMGDFINVPQMGIRLVKDFFPQGLTEFSFDTTMYLYSRNSLKNFERYRIQLRQQVTGKDIVKVGYSYIPEYLLTNLFDEDSSLHEHAFYSRHELNVFYRHDFNDYLRFRFLYRMFHRNYEHPFHERDHFENAFNGSLIFPKVFTDRVRFRFYYQFSRREARGDDDDPAIDRDISHYANTFGGSLNVRFIKRFHLTSFYEIRNRTYTTGHSAATDPFYAGRYDIRNRVGVRGEYRFKNARLFAQWEYIDNDANTQEIFKPTIANDVLDYRSHRGSWGIRFKF